jgi:hypothetical protein
MFASYDGSREGFASNEDGSASRRWHGNAEMVAAGAGMCVALHRFLRQSRGTKDCVRRAIEAGIPTYLIDSKAARPRRLLADDAQLR